MANKAFAGAAFVANLPKPLQILMEAGCETFGSLIAVRLLQRAAGLPVDGILTKNQAVAIASEDPQDLVARVLTEWALYRTGSRYFDEKGRGWLTGMFKTALDIGALPGHVT